MNRTDACALARDELRAIAAAGYGVASAHIDTVTLKPVSTASGGSFEVELSYLWNDLEHQEIRVICRITSPKDWFRHDEVQESIILCSDPVA
jgi:hypothetical protein